MHVGEGEKKYFLKSNIFQFLVVLQLLRVFLKRKTLGCFMET